MIEPRPRVLADDPLAPAIVELFDNRIEVVPWSRLREVAQLPLDGIYTYGHPLVDGALLDRCPGVRVISNYGVGVDHIQLADARQRGIPVGNTPGVLDGATADMAFTLLMAAARRLVEGDRYARSAAFTRYDPGYMLGREIHHATLGIVGLGRIGRQIARRARGFEMRVLYHNRRRSPADEAELGVSYATLDELLTRSDFVVLSVPLNDGTRGMIGAAELARMQPTAILINVARGPVVDTDALTAALQRRQIYGAGLDVTDPEPLPRDHPLLTLENVTIAPHLGSATTATRQAMAEMSVQNLFAGLDGKALPWSVSS
ncbi:MAG: D-glycerate dehydrogenase [Planctomycetes bacterium]|nr:D-glycerate dehydrogenase [Planctomycetota bacterium]